ncbi:CotY/CotZ family spore coat protein [Ornithinibacillus halotolerans]|uniref:Spore coat protein Y n=1 Tax=Ornithinibacillus halotolerans TaxID=1274357 RepID=A0A916W7W3_9BACI|nr:CotY/CotZ family spore coat protein [Ornithinibacillus halotolerans]GGA74161.1 spore coat protein Y [Ornithinibacillus halotolerans]
MGCGHGRVEGAQTGNCVCEVLRDIVDAQNDVIENCCDSSCEQSINDLLGETDPGTGLDTVPVLLYNKCDGKPFKGYGAKRGRIHDIKSSFYFRVKTVDDDCCAVLELLRDPKDQDCVTDPCAQFTGNLENTGICITVDLTCFCHVTCLPAISVFD